MKESLRSMRGHTFVGVTELAAGAAKILAESGPVQERGTVRDLPNERTVRYYLSEGLLSPAGDKQGTASIFGYVHLLQLLVIKMLQAEHLPIRKIKELVVGRTERELERLISTDARVGTKNEALDYLESLLGSSKASARSSSLKAAPAPAVLFSRPSSAIPQRQTSAVSWERVEIEPGLELHIRSDYRPPHETRAIARLGRAVIEIISRSPGKRGK
jgi:DNA-binding transcriptional MerR regulator